MGLKITNYALNRRCVFLDQLALTKIEPQNYNRSVFKMASSVILKAWIGANFIKNT